MIYSNEVNEMCCVKQGVQHGAAPIPEEAKWVKAKEISDISGLTHGVGWCAPQQGACKLTLNVKVQELNINALYTFMLLALCGHHKIKKIGFRFFVVRPYLTPAVADSRDLA